MLLSVTWTIGIASLVMLFVGLSFAYTSGVRADITRLNMRIDHLETERGNLKNEVDLLAGKINELNGVVDILNNNIQDLHSQSVPMSYQC